VPEILRGSEPRFEDMVRYIESASEGLAHHFAVEDDELRLKTNIRGGPLSPHPCRSDLAARPPLPQMIAESLAQLSL
jgi:hypothetical protein